LVYESGSEKVLLAMHLYDNIIQHNKFHKIKHLTCVYNAVDVMCDRLDGRIPKCFDKLNENELSFELLQLL